MSAEALARVLCSADGLDPDARERGAGPLWEHYRAQAARLLADPAPLLAALTEAGILREEWAVAGMDRNYGFDRTSSDYPERTLAERIQAARGGYIQHRYGTDWTEAQSCGSQRR